MPLAFVVVPFVNGGNYGKETRESLPLVGDLSAGYCLLTKV